MAWRRRPIGPRRCGAGGRRGGRRGGARLDPQHAATAAAQAATAAGRRAWVRRQRRAAECIWLIGSSHRQRIPRENCQIARRAQSARRASKTRASAGIQINSRWVSAGSAFPPAAADRADIARRPGRYPGRAVAAASSPACDGRGQAEKRPESNRPLRQSPAAERSPLGRCSPTRSDRHRFGFRSGGILALAAWMAMMASMARRTDNDTCGPGSPGRTAASKSVERPSLPLARRSMRAALHSVILVCRLPPGERPRASGSFCVPAAVVLAGRRPPMRRRGNGRRTCCDCVSTATHRRPRRCNQRRRRTAAACAGGGRGERQVLARRRFAARFLDSPGRACSARALVGFFEDVPDGNLLAQLGLVFLPLVADHARRGSSS